MANSKQTKYILANMLCIYSSFDILSCHFIWLHHTHIYTINSPLYAFHQQSPHHAILFSSWNKSFQFLYFSHKYQVFIFHFSLTLQHFCFVFYLSFGSLWVWVCFFFSLFPLTLESWIRFILCVLLFLVFTMCQRV